MKITLLEKHLVYAKNEENIIIISISDKSQSIGPVKQEIKLLSPNIAIIHSMHSLFQ